MERLDELKVRALTQASCDAAIVPGTGLDAAAIIERANIYFDFLVDTKSSDAPPARLLRESRSAA